MPFILRCISKINNSNNGPTKWAKKYDYEVKLLPERGLKFSNLLHIVYLSKVFGVCNYGYLCNRDFVECGKACGEIFYASTRVILDHCFAGIEVTCGRLRRVFFSG